MWSGRNVRVGTKRRTKKLLKLVMYNEIYVLLNYTYEWEYADKIESRETPPLFLNGEDLLKILEILETAKSKYDNAI